VAGITSADSDHTTTTTGLTLSQSWTSSDLFDASDRLFSRWWLCSWLLSKNTCQSCVDAWIPKCRPFLQQMTWLSMMWLCGNMHVHNVHIYYVMYNYWISKNSMSPLWCRYGDFLQGHSNYRLIFRRFYSAPTCHGWMYRWTDRINTETRNILDCDQSNYSTHNFFCHIPATSSVFQTSSFFTISYKWPA